MYYIMIIASLLFVFLVKNKYGKVLYSGIMFMFFFLVSGLRYDVGYDYNSYAGIFFNSYSMSIENTFQSSTEKGYLLLNKIISSYTLDYQYLYLFIAFIVALSVMYYLYKNSSMIYLSCFTFITIGCFYFSMDFLRQVLAGVIILYALNNLDKKQYLHYIVLILFAICFHKSALLMLPLMFVLLIPLNKYVLGAYGFITILLITYSTQILVFVTSFIYSGYDPLQSIHMTTGIPLIYGLCTLSIFVYAYFLKDELIKYRSLNKILLVCAFLNVFFTLIGYKHSILSRFSILIEIPVVTILLVDCVYLTLKKIRKNELKVVFISFFIIICMLFHSYLQSNNYNGVFPHQFIGEESYEI